MIRIGDEPNIWTGAADDMAGRYGPRKKNATSDDAMVTDLRVSAENRRACINRHMIAKSRVPLHATFEFPTFVSLK